MFYSSHHTMLVCLKPEISSISFTSLSNSRVSYPAPKGERDVCLKRLKVLYESRQIRHSPDSCKSLGSGP